MTQHGTASLTALVVDDLEDSRVVLRRMLETQGWCVVEAASGREALEIVRSTCPDLILMDLNMPHMDGLMAAKLIRECKGSCESVPIVAVTAYDTYGMREAALEAGFDDYLVKPLDLGSLGRVLLRVTAGW